MLQLSFGRGEICCKLGVWGLEPGMDLQGDDARLRFLLAAKCDHYDPWSTEIPSPLMNATKDALGKFKK